jgi:signal transduction histidine kinase
MRYLIFSGRKLPMAKDTSENKSTGSSAAVGSVTDNARPIEEALLGLRKLSTSLHSTLDIDQILNRAVIQSMALVAAESGLAAFCCEGISSYRYFKNGQPIPVKNNWSTGEEIPGRVVFQALPHVSNDALHDPHIDPSRATRYGVRSVVSVPLVDGSGAMIGYLEIHNKKSPAGFTRFDLEQLTTVAQIAAQAITNAKAFQKIAQDAAELEARVTERTAQLQEINEELDAFAFSVSHDLRAPLRAIQSFAEILQENLSKPDDPERGDYLGRIAAAARDMDHLILDLLDYSRLSRQELLLHAVSLAEVVREAADQLALAGEGGAFRLEVAANLPQVRGDHPVLVQVVLNLLSNAVKYVAEGVTPELRVWAEQGKDMVRLFVQDNGIGIAPENQQRIFGVFERLHGVESYQGNGIGLAIARKAVTRLGGRIGVQSQLGEGSRFWIELPGAGT